MSKLYITDPNCNLDGKPYKTLADAQAAATTKIDSFVRKVNIYECNLVCTMRRGEIITDNFTEPQFEEEGTPPIPLTPPPAE